MKREHLNNELWDYLEGRLTVEKQAMVEKHLGQCPDCREAMDRLQKLDGMIQKERSVEAPSFLYTRIQGRLERETGKKRVPRWQGALLSLSLVFAIWGGIKMGSLPSSRSMAVSQMPEYQMVNDIHQEPIEMFLLKDKDQ